MKAKERVTEVSVTLMMSADMAQRLERLAERTERSRSFLIRKAIERYLDQEEAKEADDVSSAA
jgi:predicted transcriptional regulator